ncbi:uncharacterized protein Dvar_28080 [Desulfosarcina variabilis str. Montpellier]|uniref:SUMF1/EgtB/PvdO family nonheme iron enzyme n=1 Tax=Desulfosarcina variabilis TaxID=2300 RepID=UPI003AFB4AC0
MAPYRLLKLESLATMAVFLFWFCPTALASPDANAAARGLFVETRTITGSTREIKLYDGYHALVVGCGAYRAGWPFLPNPVKDAREVAAMLKGLGWHVETLENPDSRIFRRSLNRLITGPGKKKEIAILFWYSGHGHTLAEADETKLGYLVPVDAPDPEKDLPGFMDSAISMRTIETVSKQISSKHVLMAFDSCFSGAIFQMVRARPSSYVQEKVAYPVRQFITAGTEDEQVPDRSIFKDVFIQAIQGGFADLNQDTYITGEELGGYLQEHVVNYTRKAQHPQFGKINNPKLDKGDFVFLRAGSEAITDPSTPAPVPSQAQGRLTAVTNVSHAEVIVDGRTSLNSITVAPGPHRVPVNQKDFNAYRNGVVTTPAADQVGILTSNQPFQQGMEQVSGFPKSRLTNSLGMYFVYIQPGAFMMGRPTSDPQRNSDERQHKVTLTQGYYLQTTEVTQGQWKQVVGSSPSYFKNCGSDCPVENVSWHDAQLFIQRLNQREGTETYRLPTEAEWEYAARAGTQTPFSFGDCLSTDQANYNGHYPIHGCGKGQYREHLVPVGRFSPNDWGLHDMHGNVCEWCQDWYGDYPTGSVTDPQGPESGEARIYRGGSWGSGARDCRSAFRQRLTPVDRGIFLGLRLARTR